MLSQAAEARFQKGLISLNAGRGIEALALFETAIELERRQGARTPQARYLSWYGLCLALEGRRPKDGAELCRQAVGLEFFNADLCWNYGRVLLILDRRREAYHAFLKGLSVQRSHQGILKELGRMGWRRRPVVPFLTRRNPINVALGRMLRTGPQRPVGAPVRPPRAARTA
jgi:tetratricopeptide (TPR) repeat protein